MLRTLRNLLLLEVLAITAFIGIISAILLNRLAYYQEAAEKANVELVISTMKSALRMRMASMMIEGRMAHYGKLADDNPMEWLEQRPSEYAGEMLPATSRKMQSGAWVFDRATHILTYWPKRAEHFQPDSEGRHRIRLRIQLLTETASVQNRQVQLVTGARLVLVEPYKWF